MRIGSSGRRAAARGLRRLGVLLAIAICGIGSGSAAAADAMPYGEGLLWKIQAPHRAPSYVFGTMHVADKRVTALPKPVSDALGRVDDLNLELDFGSGFGDYEARMMRLPPRQTLSGILGADLFARVRKRLGAATAKMRTLERLKPWVVLMALTRPERHPGGGSPEGRLPLDLELRAIALKRGIPVFGLETYEEQLDIFDKLPEADQVDMIRTALQTSERRSAHALERMIRLYLARDLAGLVGLTQTLLGQGGIADIAAFDKRLVDDRNRVMARRAETVLIDGGAFIAVGAAHLPGDKGLLNLLAKRGYEVERVY